jgi:hypothetical protein
MCAANSDAQFSPSEEFTNHALVLATLPSLVVPYFLSPLITAAATAAKTRLTIVLFSRLFAVHNSQAPFSHTAQWHSVQQLLTYVYVQASKVAQDMDNILLDINVLLKGMDDELDQNIIAGVECVYRARGGKGNISFSSDLISIPAARFHSCLPSNVSYGYTSLLPTRCYISCADASQRFGRSLVWQARRSPRSVPCRGLRRHIRSSPRWT